MALDITQRSLDKAALVLLVGEDGLYEWSSDRTAREVAKHLRKIADAIEADGTPVTPDERDRIKQLVKESCAEAFDAGWERRATTSSTAGRDLMAYLDSLTDEGTTKLRTCEAGCGCRYGTDDADHRDCGCDGPCTMADLDVWGCAGLPDANCGGDCPSCPDAARRAAETRLAAVRALIAPEAEMAVLPFGRGERYFSERNIRAALDGETS